TWMPYYYDADGIAGYESDQFKGWGFKRRPSIFMPRWASRITLLIEDVRVERLQDISEADAKAEGVLFHSDEYGYCGYGKYAGIGPARLTAKQSFKSLWDYVNGHDSWRRNEWVFVYSFKPILANVDAVIANPEKYGITNANR